MKLHKRYILLYSLALLLISGFLSGRFFVQRNFSTYIKNVIDIPNVLMEQVPGHKDGLTQNQANEYTKIKNRIWEETREMDHDGIDTRVLIKAIIDKDQIDVTDTVNAFKEIIQSYETDLSPYMEKGFSAERISSSAITSALDYQMVLISLYMNTPIILLLTFIYIMTSYGTLIVALLLLAGSCIYLRQKWNGTYLLLISSKACYFSGSFLCCFTMMLYVVMNQLSYRIMRYMGSFSGYNYLLLFILSAFFVILGMVLKALTKKETVADQ